MRKDLTLRNVLSVILGGMVGASVAACSSLPGASTVHRLTAPKPPALSRAHSEHTYVVQRGDTLYSIAHKFNVDYIALAMINDVKDDSTIRPKQKLRIPRT